jgi:D-alanyl-lipoteichoic acid acyltransferase DltB (MBOAT superfamily)
MLFNSFAFAVFLPLVFALYWGIFNKSKNLRNMFLLAASYVFYGWWDWRFLSLIVISSYIDFFVGQRIGEINDREDSADNARRRKRWLWVSLSTNIGILGFFKYCNFFTDSFAEMFSAFGITVPAFSLNIILPVGISFYTFQTLSYTLDIYNRKLKPVKDWVQFFTFVSFFPQLVAGPIERAKNLLPQFENLHRPDYSAFRNAMLLIAWGFFKKLMIADRLAVYVDSAFGNIAAAEGLPMSLGVVFFAFQLYLDFSAYSDIAIGVAGLFGFGLCSNFNRPYLSLSFSNFWKRWHISLSSWWQDYLYIPLGGNRKSKTRKTINIIIVFAVSGLWHGASWNFVIWGLLNALFMLVFDPLLFQNKTGKGIIRILKSLFIFCCWAFSLSFFRAQGFDAAIDCIRNMGFGNMASIINFGLNAAELKLAFLLLGILFLKEIIWENRGGKVSVIFFKLPVIVRWIFYIAIVLSIIYFGQYGGDNENAFIYFQF